MIESIIADTEKSVAVAIQAENDSQKAYEKMVRDRLDIWAKRHKANDQRRKR